LWSRRRTIEQAELALAARKNVTWLDPKLLGSAIQVSRTVGWRKLVPLLAVGMLAAGVGMEWFSRDRAEVRYEGQHGRRKLARDRGEAETGGQHGRRKLARAA